MEETAEGADGGMPRCAAVEAGTGAGGARSARRPAGQGTALAMAPGGAV